MKVWKQQIAEGNRLFAEGAHNGARNAYINAIERAIQLLPLWFEPDEAVAAVLVSYHNFGDCLIAQAQVDNGIACYEKAEQVLRAELASEAPETERYLALLKGVSQALSHKVAAIEQLQTNDITDGKNSNQCEKKERSYG